MGSSSDFSRRYESWLLNRERPEIKGHAEPSGGVTGHELLPRRALPGEFESYFDLPSRLAYPDTRSWLSRTEHGPISRGAAQGEVFTRSLVAEAADLAADYSGGLLEGPLRRLASGQEEEIGSIQGWLSGDAPVVREHGGEVAPQRATAPYGPLRPDHPAFGNRYSLGEQMTEAGVGMITSLPAFAVAAKVAGPALSFGLIEALLARREGDSVVGGFAKGYLTGGILHRAGELGRLARLGLTTGAMAKLGSSHGIDPTTPVGAMGPLAVGFLSSIPGARSVPASSMMSDLVRFANSSGWEKVTRSLGFTPSRSRALKAEILGGEVPAARGDQSPRPTGRVQPGAEAPPVSSATARMSDQQALNREAIAISKIDAVASADKSGNARIPAGKGRWTVGEKPSVNEPGMQVEISGRAGDYRIDIVAPDGSLVPLGTRFADRGAAIGEARGVVDFLIKDQVNYPPSPNAKIGDSRQSGNGQLEIIQNAHANLKNFNREVADIVGKEPDVHFSPVTGVPDGARVLGGSTSRVKTLESVIKKRRLKPKSPDNIGDYIGTRIVIDDPRSLPGLLRRFMETGRVLHGEVEGWLAGGAPGKRIVDANGNVLVEASRGGYRAVHLNLVTKNGKVSGEVQIVTREQLAASEGYRTATGRVGTAVLRGLGAEVDAGMPPGMRNGHDIYKEISGHMIAVRERSNSTAGLGPRDEFLPAVKKIVKLQKEMSDQYDTAWNITVEKSQLTSAKEAQIISELESLGMKHLGEPYTRPAGLSGSHIPGRPAKWDFWKSAEENFRALNRAERRQAGQVGYKKKGGKDGEGRAEDPQAREKIDEILQSTELRPLAEDSSRYFKKPEGTVDVSIDNLRPTHAQASGVENANRYMEEAYSGARGKREPLSLRDNGDGTYDVLDGNSTYANALASGWKELPGIVKERMPPAPPSRQRSLSERPGWELTREQEAQAQGGAEAGITAERISALERAPAPPREGPKGGLYERPPHGEEMARGTRRATPEEIADLKTVGLLDEAGELTAKGREILERRLQRFRKFRDAASNGKTIDRGAARDWPLQIGQAYRHYRAMKPRGRRKAPGKDEADNLSVNEAKSVSQDILGERIREDIERGRDLLKRMEESGAGVTEPRLSSEMNAKVAGLAKDLFARGDVTYNPHVKTMDQVADFITSGLLPLEEVELILARRGFTLDSFERAYRLTNSEAGRQLNLLRQVQDSAKIAGVTRPRREAILERLENEDLGPRSRRKLEEELDRGFLTEAERAELEALGVDASIVKSMGWYRRLENIRRGGMVSQISTMMRNAQGQLANVTIGGMNQAMEHAIRGLARGTGKTIGSKRVLDYGDSVHPVKAFETFLGVFKETGARGRRWSSEGTEFVSNVLGYFPKQRDLLTSSFNADIARLRGGRGVLGRWEDAVYLLNTFNRFQEHIFRRAAFRAELSRQVEMSPVEGYGRLEGKGSLAEADLLGAIPQEMIRRSVERALEVTWAKDFSRKSSKFHERGLGRFIDLINAVPFFSHFMPFPRFVGNSLKYQIEHSPAGMFRYFWPDARERLLNGDVSGISKGMTGTTMFLAALKMADSEYATDVWHQYGLPEWTEHLPGPLKMDKGATMDIRPYAPFSAYPFAAYIWKKGVRPLLEGRETELHSMTTTDLAQGLLASNMRAGLGLFAVDKLMAELLRLKDDPSFANASELLGAAMGKLGSSFLVPLNLISDLEKKFDQYNNDMESSIVRDASGPVEDPDATVNVEQIKDPLRVFAETFKGEIATRLPGVSAGYPEVQDPLQKDPPVTYAPLWKASTGFTFASPKGIAKRETERFDFSPTDILPPSGNPVFDRLVSREMGIMVDEVLNPRLEGEYYQETLKTRAQKVDYLRTQLEHIRNEARRRVRINNPDLSRTVKDESADYRRERLIEDRRGW